LFSIAMTFEHGADVAGPSGNNGDDKSIYKSKSEEVFVTGSGDLDAVYGVGGVGHTHRRLKARHVTFIGFGGGIGTGLFVGTGAALASAGPLGLLLAYSVVGLILWCVMESVGEIATLVRSCLLEDTKTER
jgi:amino acid transporter